MTLIVGMSKSPDSPAKVLLADDSVTMHRAVSLGLKKEPYEVVTSDNGSDALRIAMQIKPAFVLADLDMPGLPGIELCKKIKAEPSLAHTKVILLCGSFDQIDEQAVASSGADGKLWKPFEGQVLVSMLKTLGAAPSHGSSSEATAAISTDSLNIPEETTAAALPKSAVEATAPKGKRPPPPPMARTQKEKAIENNRSQVADLFEQKKPGAAKSEELRVALEATRPIQSTIDEEISGVLPEVGEDDFTKELTQETFRTDVTQEASIAASPTAPIKQPKEVTATQQQFTENLWDLETLNPPTEATQFADVNDLEEAAVPSDAELEEDFDILNTEIQTQSVDLVDAELLHADQKTLGIPEDVLNDAADATGSNLVENANLNFQSPPEVAGGEVQAIVRNEVEKIFNDWLKGELKRELDKVMKELDNL